MPERAANSDAVACERDLNESIVACVLNAGLESDRGDAVSDGLDDDPDLLLGAFEDLFSWQLEIFLARAFHELSNSFAEERLPVRLVHCDSIRIDIFRNTYVSTDVEFQFWRTGIAGYRACYADDEQHAEPPSILWTIFHA